ncbi:MAG: hypothetical protein ACRCTI_10585, partial [Beijerinckiaceae bacterium]
LTIPFILFGLTPINGVELYPSPGFDGYGSYNRHGALLLYLLAATLLFVEHRARSTALAIVLLGALFLVKITGLIVGLAILAYAALCGRLAWRGAAIGAALIAPALLFAEWRWTLVSAYLGDIAQLVGMNTGFLLPRVLTVASINLDVVIAAAALVAALLWMRRDAWISNLRALAGPERMTAFRTLLDRDEAWIAMLVVAGAVYETQNTGSHEFILLWPAMLRLLAGLVLPFGRNEIIILLLVAATALPTPIGIMHRAARTIASAVKYEPVHAPHLGPIGRVSAKPEIMQHARTMLAHYADARGSFEALAKRNLLPSYILFSEIDFQVSWLISTQQAAEAVIAYEARRGRPFERIVTLDFVDAMPVALGRTPLRGMSIG